MTSRSNYVAGVSPPWEEPDDAICPLCGQAYLNECECGYDPTEIYPYEDDATYPYGDESFEW